MQETVAQHSPEIRRIYSLTREEFLQRFIEPWDQEDLQRRQDLDMFMVDPETGYDALLHIFCGETTIINDYRTVSGFHLASTAPDASTRTIFLDRNKLTPTSASRLERHDFEPYKAPVEIQGVAKRNANGLKIRNNVRIATNPMFGRAYDAYSIIRTLTDAVRNRDRSEDVESEKASVRKGNEAIYFVYDMPILGSEETAPVKIVLDKRTEQIITAAPRLRSNATAEIGHVSLVDIHDKLIN